MAKRKSKVSAYTRNRNRIMANVRKLRKEGKYIDIYIPTEKQLKKMGVVGTELTKQTNTLKKITAQHIKQKATDRIIPNPFGEGFLDQETGKVLKTKDQATAVPHSPATRVNAREYEDDVRFTLEIEGFKQRIQSIVAGFNQTAIDRVMNAINSMIDKVSKGGTDNERLAVMLNQGGYAVEFKHWYAYDDSALNDYIADLLDYLPDIGDNEKEEILESLTFENGESYAL